jgi:hypothetical protein
MGKDRGVGARLRFEARCAWCGPVTLPGTALSVYVDSRGAGLYEFPCPSCERLNIRSLNPPDLEALAQAGVCPSPGTAPFELLEERTGPPIEWDDLIDFHQALAGTEGGSDRTLTDGRSTPRVLERDAA